MISQASFLFLILSLTGFADDSGFRALHPLHVSVTEINLDEKDKSLEIIMRVFVDDLEKTLQNKLAQPELELLELKKEALDKIASPYLADHFRIMLDGKAQKINYLGHEKDGEALVFYIEVSGVKKWQTIQVQNDIITETHADQSNLVHVTVRGTVRSIRLTRDTPADKITFDQK